jgi:hypothetical protein
MLGVKRALVHLPIRSRQFVMRNTTIGHSPKHHHVLTLYRDGPPKRLEYHAGPIQLFKVLHKGHVISLVPQIRILIAPNIENVVTNATSR